MKSTLDKYKSTVFQLQEKENFLKKELDKLQKERIMYMEEFRGFEESRDIVNTVLSVTQGGIKSYVERMVSLSLKSVFGNEYEFKLSFELKRGQSEAKMRILKDGVELDPKSEVGGGVIDVVALALRLTLWSIRKPKSSPVFILDEPGKYLSSVGGLRTKFGEIIKKFSELFSCQFIVVSHDEELIEFADKVIVTEIENGTTRIHSE